MNRVIWKYEVEFWDTFTVEMPENPRILSVQLQRNIPQMWVLVDPSAPVKKFTFHVIETGNPVEIADNWRYVGTFQMYDGGLVLHVFGEVPE